MSDAFAVFFGRLLATDSPLLPLLSLQQAWLHLAWGVVLAMLGSAWAGRWHASRSRQLLVALAMAAWCWVPGAWGASFWLGLAFQAPSAMTAWICVVMLGRRFAKKTEPGLNGAATPLFWPVLGVVIGWALLLDSLALLPWQMYALGFSPIVPVLAVVVAVGAWCADRPAESAGGGWLAAALLVFVSLRLPSGNAWDALLDPWLWLMLHGVCVWVLLQRHRIRKLARGQAA